MANEKKSINTPEAKKIASDMKLELNLEPKGRYKKGEYAKMSDGMVP